MVSIQRPALLAIYAALLAILTLPALNFAASPINWPLHVTAQASLLVLIPAAALYHSVLARVHSFAWSVYWTWSLVFLGLAGAYQLAKGTFPWGGVLHEGDISTAQRIVLMGHAAAIAAFTAMRLRERTRQAPTASLDTANSPRLRTGIITALNVHTGIAALFAALMGPAMFSGRQTFQAGLAAHEGLPGFGTMYFLSNAGAIVLPPMAILLSKRGLSVPVPAMVLSVMFSFLVTNPMIGSRFLTGSFFVAVTAALIGPQARRWMPAGIILAFVTVFPTLDLLRGDGTGAREVAFTAPMETLTTFDYDAFEMLTREVSLHGELNTDISRTDLAVAPFLRWIPVLSQSVQGHASGPVVATSTGMGYTNVSMPLWGEADLIGAGVGVLTVFAALGFVLGRVRHATLFATLLDMPLAALLFIVLRGSLYEVLGYVLLAYALAALFSLLARRDGSLTAVTYPVGPALDPGNQHSKSRTATE